jgi:hypothetical protein
VQNYTIQRQIKRNGGSKKQSKSIIACMALYRTGPLP